MVWLRSLWTGRSYRRGPQQIHASRGARTREKYIFCLILCAIMSVLKTGDRMNFALRRQLALSSGWVLTSRYPHPHPLRRPLLLLTKARRMSSRSTSENTRVASSSFPPLPDTLPKPPAYPCPHLTNSNALKPLYERHWRIHASYNNARDAKTVALEKKFTLTKYRHTLELFNDVMGLQGICAQEKVYPSRITRDSVTNTMTCLASPNRCPVYIHDVDVHAEDLECCPCPISARHPAFPRNNIKGCSFGYPYRETL